MHATTILISGLALGIVRFAQANEGIENDDVPDQCRDTCRSVVELSDSCDDQSFSSNDRELQCICTGTNMASAIPACEACIRPFWEASDDDDYDETNNLLRRCNLSAVNGGSGTDTGMTNMPSSTSTVAGTTSAPSSSSTTSVSTSTSTDASGSPVAVVSTVTVAGGVGGAMATPAAGVGFAAFIAAVVAL